MSYIKLETIKVGYINMYEYQMIETIFSFK